MLEKIWNYISIPQLINVFALLVTFYLFILKKNKIEPYFLLLLMTLFFGETIIGFIVALLYSKNIIVINILCHLTILWYYFIYRRHLEIQYFNYVIGIWLVFTITNFLLYDRINYLITTSYIFGLAIITIVALKYIYTKITDLRNNKLWSDFRVWLGIGITLFFFTSFPVLLYINEMIISNKDYTPFYNLLYAGNIILSISYLCSSIVIWKS